MKNLALHYKNKYPGGSVRASDSGLDVYTQSGEHVVAIRKNGAGQFVCVSEEMGLRDSHCLAPIPKDARLFKMRDGKISKDELHDERRSKFSEFLCPEKKDMIVSCDGLKKHGYSFCEKQTVQSRPQKKAAAPKPAPQEQED